MAETARRVKKRGTTDGMPLESAADAAAIITLGIALLAGLGAIVSALQTPVPFVSLPVVIAIGVGGFFGWLMWRVVAEHIRLQKAIAGLRYSGEISGHREREFWACSACGVPVHSDSRCDGCGKAIESDDASSDSL
ncbi:MAG: hypothetical protein Aurels2KO_43650 [Aureliella sp.]